MSEVDIVLLTNDCGLFPKEWAAVIGRLVSPYAASALASDGERDGYLEMGLEVAQDQFSLMLVQLGDKGLAILLERFLGHGIDHGKAHLGLFVTDRLEAESDRPLQATREQGDDALLGHVLAVGARAL